MSDGHDPEEAGPHDGVSSQSDAAAGGDSDAAPESAADSGRGDEGEPAVYQTIPIVPRRLPSAASYFGEPRAARHSAAASDVPEPRADAAPESPASPEPSESAERFVAEPSSPSGEPTQNWLAGPVAVPEDAPPVTVANEEPVASETVHLEGPLHFDTAPHPLALDLSALKSEAESSAPDEVSDEPEREPEPESGVAWQPPLLLADLPTHDDVDQTPTAAFGAVFGDVPTAPVPRQPAEAAPLEPAGPLFIEPVAPTEPSFIEPSFTEVIGLEAVPAELADVARAPSTFDWQSLPEPVVAPVDEVHESPVAGAEPETPALEPEPSLETEPALEPEPAPQPETPEPAVLEDESAAEPWTLEPADGFAADEPPLETAVLGAVGPGPLPDPIESPAPWWLADRAAAESAAAEPTTADSDASTDTLVPGEPETAVFGTPDADEPAAEPDFDDDPLAIFAPVTEPSEPTTPIDLPGGDFGGSNDPDGTGVSEGSGDSDSSWADQPLTGSSMLPIAPAGAPDEGAPAGTPDEGAPWGDGAAGRGRSGNPVIDPAERTEAGDAATGAVLGAAAKASVAAPSAAPTFVPRGPRGPRVRLGDGDQTGEDAWPASWVGAAATLPSATTAVSGSGGGDGTFSSWSRNRRIAVAVVVGVVFVIVLVAIFFGGRALVGGSSPAAAPAPVASTAGPVASSAPPSPSAVPSAQPTPAPTGPAAAGTHPWSDLRGGECLSSYQNAWQQTYDVVDCATPHVAQLVSEGTLDGAAGSAYPGMDALQSQVSLKCSSSASIDFSKASAYSDVQVAGSYPSDETQWAAGSRTYYCFVSRSSGQTITGSIAAG